MFCINIVKNLLKMPVIYPKHMFLICIFYPKTKFYCFKHNYFDFKLGLVKVCIVCILTKHCTFSLCNSPYSHYPTRRIHLNLKIDLKYNVHLPKGKSFHIYNP